jgi:site-specific DNA recombinase
MLQLKGDRIGAYARYSSDNQRESSIDDQLRRFGTALAPTGRTLNRDLIFTDYAVSGKSTDGRVGFEALMRKVKARELDVLIVESVSRLARNQGDSARLYEELAYYDVQLICLDDGIDTNRKGAKFQFGAKALFADVYLDDLREMTLRGMEGCAVNGLSTGGRVLGYRSVAQYEADGRTPAGFRVEIDPETSKIVIRIFDLYQRGHSLSGIATLLNKEGVPSPRDLTRHERKGGWSGGTIRAILYNARYVGVCTFNERRWVRVPGTKKRRPIKKDPSEIIRTVREELRIIDQQTWDAVQDRLRAIKELYTQTADGKPKGRAHGAVSFYPLSGLLFCKCGSPMTVRGGSEDRRYYFCAASGRGRCDNRKGVLTETTRSRILGAIRERLTSPAGVAHARKKLAELLGEAGRSRDAELRDARARLARAEKRIANLVDVLASGERSQAITDALKDMEAHAAAERRGVAELEAFASATVRLPAPNDMLERVWEIEERLKQDPIAGRERLRRLVGGEIKLELNEDGVYVARMNLLPLVLLEDVSNRPPGRGASLNVGSSGGRI